jgi:uncharacterized RDD family membrane protein YckC
VAPSKDALEGKQRVRELLAPEGVPLRVTIADAGTRSLAFLADLILLTIFMTLIKICFSLAGGASGWLTALVQIAIFLLWNFYFVFFELRWQGATPGKRWAGIRVIDADGGPLTADAVFARNLMRTIELYIPVSILIAPELVFGESAGWFKLAATAWALVLLFLPLFNRDRLRVGDLVAGTMVVLAPRTNLLADVGAEKAGRAAVHPFTDKQLGVYGVYELQVLEKLLRSSDVLDYHDNLVRVSERIRNKIKYTPRIVDPEAFLKDYYAALRNHLERRMLFGRKKKDKFSRSDSQF